MTPQEKTNKVKELVIEMLNNSLSAMTEKIDVVFASGYIDIDCWDEKTDSMILPKSITMALLESESYQYSGRGTSFEKMVKKEVKNIRYFI